MARGVGIADGRPASSAGRRLSIRRALLLLLRVVVVRGFAFFANSFAQLSISATVCSTDSRAA